MARKIHDGRNDKRKKKPSEKRKKSGGIFPVLAGILAIAILVLVALIFFRIRDISVEGNTYTADEAIVQVVQDDSYSVNSLYVLGKYLIGRGGTLPSLESIRVSLKSPWELKVTVTEKPRVGYFESEKQYLCVDTEGMIVEICTDPPEELPALEGVDAESKALYQTVSVEDKTVFADFYDAVCTLKEAGLSVTKLTLEDEEVCLYLDKVCVDFGAQITEEKTAQIAPIMEKLGDQAGTLHLETYTSETGTVTFEKKKSSKKEAADEESDEASDDASEEE